MHNIKRNKKVFDYLEKQIKRLHWDISISDVFSEYIFENLSVSDSKEVLISIKDKLTHSALDNDALLMETLKFIGLMEVCAIKDELLALINKRNEIKYGTDLTDFDKVLKAIITVPNLRKEKK